MTRTENNVPVREDDDDPRAHLYSLMWEWVASEAGAAAHAMRRLRADLDGFDGQEVKP